MLLLMIIVVLCILILCMRRSHRKKEDHQVSRWKTKLNTVITKTNPVYDATNLDRAGSNTIKQGSDVPITANPSYKVSTKSSNSKRVEDGYTYALPYQIKEHQSSCSAVTEQRHYVNAHVANTKLTGGDGDYHYYSTVK